MTAHSPKYRETHAALATALGRAAPEFARRTVQMPVAPARRFVPKGYVTIEESRERLTREIASRNVATSPPPPALDRPAFYWTRERD